MTGKERAWKAWRWIAPFESLVNTILLLCLIAGAGIWWWHSQTMSSHQATQGLERAVQRIEAVTQDLGDVENTARTAHRLARTNEQGLSELRGRVMRNENRQNQRDEELISRLERIESLLLERRQ